MALPTQFSIGNLATWLASSIIPADRQLVAARRPDGTVQAKFGNASGHFADLPELYVDPAQVANAPSGTAGANKVAWRNGSNAYSWGAASEVVAAALGWKIATDPAYGADSTGSSDSTSALQACLNAAAAAGTTAYLNGTFKVTAVITITGDVDAHTATINYTPSGAGGVAIQVGNPAATLTRASVSLPKLINTKKTTTGWAQTGVSGSVGVKVSNCYSCSVTVPHVQGFETGLRIGGYANGTSYLACYLGHLDNNKVNENWTADATGWANQNNVFGGRMSHNSAEGTAVSGTRHVMIDSTASKINNNAHWGTSLESPNTVEYHLDCAGNDNYFNDCRWENTGTGARVNWATNSVGNVIAYGFGSHTIVETKGTGTANHLVNRARSRMVGDGAALDLAVLALENTASSTKAAIRIMEAGAESAGTSQTTGWAVEISAQHIKGKRTGDSDIRADFDLVNGRLYFGAGNAASTRYIGNVGTSLGFDGASVCFVTDNTYDFGIASLRPRYVRIGTAVQTGAFATGSRPSASTAGAGAMIFDTTLGKPVWSTGSAWVDATGAAA
jgi:hypothetical protein